MLIASYTLVLEQLKHDRQCLRQVHCSLGAEVELLIIDRSLNSCCLTDVKT